VTGTIGAPPSDDVAGEPSGVTLGITRNGLLRLRDRWWFNVVVKSANAVPVGSGDGSAHTTSASGTRRHVSTFATWWRGQAM
jgi:hypothetical protein